MGVHGSSMFSVRKGPDIELDRIVVAFWAAAAFAVALIYLVVSAVSGIPQLVFPAIGALVASIILSVMLVKGRHDGRTATLAIAAIVAVWSVAFPETHTIVPASVTLVVNGALGGLFIKNRPILYAVLFGTTLAVIPQFWGLQPSDAVLAGAVQALAFVMTYLILVSIHRTATALTTRYQLLFESSPAAVIDQDWSSAVAYLRSEQNKRMQPIGDVLESNREVVAHALGLVRIVRANQAANELLMSDDLVSDRSQVGLVLSIEDNSESVVSVLTAMCEGEKSWTAEIAVPSDQGGTRCLQLRAEDTSTGAPATSVLVGLTDISHLKARDRAMAALIEAKDQFIANISHELRTPLTAVVGLTSQLVQEPTLSSGERAELLGLVAEQAQETVNIVDDLLVAARSQMGTVAVTNERVDLLAELRTTIEGLGLEIEIPLDQPPSVAADPHRVRQILRNLLTNAVRYGGPNRSVQSGSDSEMAWIEVVDDGTGISEGLAVRVFEPYVTGNEGVEGSVGLGLSVSRQLAELMGGSLSYVRSEGLSHFRLELPRTRQPALISRPD